MGRLKMRQIEKPLLLLGPERGYREMAPNGPRLQEKHGGITANLALRQQDPLFGP